MNAFNIVRVRVKPGHDQAFIEAHRRADTAFKGWLRGALVKTGERAYCIVGDRQLADKTLVFLFGYSVASYTTIIYFY